MSNWYAVTVTSRVDRYGVDCTRTVAIESDCNWTSETLTPVVAELATQEQGFSNPRIVDFRPIDPVKPSGAQGIDRVLNLDRLLGI